MRDYPPTTIDQARHDVIQRAAERNEYPPDLPTGRAIPWVCPRGKRGRHKWESDSTSLADNPQDVIDCLVRRNVNRVIWCAECGLTQTSKKIWGDHWLTVWWPAAEYYLWMDVQQECEDRAAQERELAAA